MAQAISSSFAPTKSSITRPHASMHIGSLSCVPSNFSHVFSARLLSGRWPLSSGLRFVRPERVFLPLMTPSFL